ncbi:serine hydrolase domain-containing protein [Nocardioides pocheonensis]|uniref:Class A beta-lactamase-related serine hydrolase n=1 Tax=Nocardioides pocheonensis TaxID=661485 RepID=A0A3N0GIB2_9ACTN|nr:serine hydrolase domain-containing protein [Nocardioides pocheonensis]RNM12171.1 class A beta-lactamase-related serine hydrolase [Nocardioides pocheonensis]
MSNTVDRSAAAPAVASLAQLVDDAVSDGVAPFLVAMVADRDGVRWQHCAGLANATHPASPDSVLSIFSATKAVGGLMAVMAIDRGLITMDTPVGDVLPQFDKLQVLESVGPNGPVFRKPKRRATLRHLLTHTSGMGLEFYYPLMAEYAARTGAPSDVTGTFESLNYPLLFDPGEDFAYGIGLDWVGALVAELDGRSIDRFVQEEILEPLGMKHTYFERAAAGDQLATIRLKRPDGEFEPMENFLPENPEIYHMGYALYSSSADYLTFLRLVLNEGELDGRRLVSPEAMQLMYTDQLPGVALPTPILKSSAAIICDTEPCPGTRKTHTAGFFRNEDALPGMRNVGSLFWGGALNTHYWADPHAGIAAVFMTQMSPFFEPRLMERFTEFERTVYRDLVN